MPAFIDKDDRAPGWSATTLAPGNTDAIFGATETALALYWAACHGKVVDDVYKGGERLGKEFGYHVTWTWTEENGLEDKVVQRPSDALGW